MAIFRGNLGRRHTPFRCSVHLQKLEVPCLWKNSQSVLGVEMTRNTVYLLGIWSVVGLFFLIVLVIPLSLGFGVALWHGETEMLTEMLVLLAVAIFVAVALFIGIRKYQARRFRRLLQSPSPDALLAFYRRSIRPGLIPNEDAFLAHGCANAYILYGQFADARSQLRSVAWEHRTPVIVALRQSAEALLCYFDSRDYEQGLATAKSAEQLAKVPRAFPGAATSQAAFAAHVQIGEVLTGQSTPSTIEALEIHYRQLPLLGKLLVAWALVQAYRQSRNLQGVNAMEKFIRETAPNCPTLHSP
jgi:hypothetical protein